MNIHAVSVSDHAGYFHGHVDGTLAELGLSERFQSTDILNVIDGYKGSGYGMSTRSELEWIAATAAATGVALDPIYTGKAGIGLHDMLGLPSEDRRSLESSASPDWRRTRADAGAEVIKSAFGTLAGKRVLFLHTGGVFGLFDGRMQAQLFPGQLSSWQDE